MSRSVNLARLLPPHPPLAEVLPDLAEHGRALGIDVDSPQPLHRIMATRSLAREIAAALPADTRTLDCAEIEMLTTPFVHELLSLRPTLALVNADADMQWAWSTAKAALHGLGER